MFFTYRIIQTKQRPLPDEQPSGRRRRLLSSLRERGELEVAKVGGNRKYTKGVLRKENPGQRPIKREL